MRRNAILLAVFGVVSSASAAWAGEAEDTLKKYDAIMSPPIFEGNYLMSSKRDDGSTRSYEMKLWVSGTDKSRIKFTEPPAMVGQEVLRVDDNIWSYQPNLKRSVRLASRDSFQGGDFNNADVVRGNYSADYNPTVAEKKGDEIVLDLKAKTANVAYDRIKLWVKATGQPVKGEFYTSSGKLLRSASYSDPKDFGFGPRPTKIHMENKVQTARSSDMIVKGMKKLPSLPDTFFNQSELGK